MTVLDCSKPLSLPTRECRSNINIGTRTVTSLRMPEASLRSSVTVLLPYGFSCAACNGTRVDYCLGPRCLLIWEEESGGSC